MKKKLFAEAYFHPKHHDYTFMFRIVSCNKVNLPANFVNNFMQNRNSEEMKNCSKKQIILSTNQNSYYLRDFFPSRSSQDRIFLVLFQQLLNSRPSRGTFFPLWNLNSFILLNLLSWLFFSIRDSKFVWHCKTNSC